MSDVRDLIIIGAGPAGYIAAIRAAQLGVKVTVIENDNLGGTCLNIGCIPTKTLLSFSENIYGLKNPKKGISIGSVDLNVENIYAYKDEVVNKLKTGIAGLFKSWNIELIRGKASFASVNEIKVNNSVLTFKKALIATGSKPFIPKSLFVEGFTVDSDYILSNPIRGKVAVVGGGVIGTEFAFILNSLGCEVSIIEKEPGLLPLEDRDCVRFVDLSLKKKGIKVFCNSGVEKIEKGFLHLQNGNKLEADICFVAIGRRSNTDGLHLDNARVNVDEKGAVTVNDNFRTSNENIYAVGDVNGKIQLAHYASACSVSVIESILEHKSLLNLTTVPRVTYTIPEIASVGINETQANAAGLAFKIGRVMYGIIGKAVAMGETDGIAKVIVDENDVVIGASIAGKDAENLLSIFTLACAMKIKVTELASIIYPHPSLSEIILEVCEDVHGRSIHKMNRNIGRVNK